MDETRKILAERLKKLPKDIRNAIQAANLRSELKNISQKYHLQVDQAGILEDEVVLVMLGLDSPDDFSENFARETHIPEIQVRLITQDVGSKIFAPIGESLRQMLEKEVGEEEQTTTSQAMEDGETSRGRGAASLDDKFRREVHQQPESITLEENASPPLAEELHQKPTSTSPKETNQRDPYREPIE